MEWVETTAKTLDEAKDRALDQLGVAADDAEFEVLDEPKAGLFGRLRGEARVRARVRPTSVRPKQDRRVRGRNRGRSGGKKDGGTRTEQRNAGSERSTSDAAPKQSSQRDGNGSGSNGRGRRSGSSSRGKQPKEQVMDQDESATVSPQEVGDAAVTFMSGLADAFGTTSTTSVTIDGTEIDVKVDGDELGLMVGPGGRTLAAVQDLARVASQRRLGDHDTRLRIDVGGYREKRRGALEKFAGAVADEVRESGTPKALEPMPSADRKIVHDAIVAIEGVSSRSEGDDPRRRVVITPD
jgi:spoIIIJ-associated protein